MFAKKLVQRNILQGKQFCSNVADNNVTVYLKVVSITTAIGGICGGCNGIYNGYKFNRHKSLSDCIINTTFEFVGNTCVGLYCGGIFGILGPLLFPIVLISAPVACGVGIVNCFDKKIN